MRRVLLLLALGLAGAQSSRWEGDPEYRTFPGVPTAAGPSLDKSYALVYPAQGEFRGTVLLVPGFLGGATNFDALARRLIRAAPGWEVWAWDRRSNGLEDRSGIATADPWAYYQRYELPDLPFLKDWGLKVHLDDLERLVDAARARGPVVLAGHSLGASLAALFALYRPQKLWGLILLDGTPNLIRFGEEQYRNGGNGQFGPTPGLNQLLEGKAPPYITLFGLDPIGFAQAEAQAFMAAQAPQADAPPGWAPWRASRVAAALYRVDDRYQPFPVFAVSLGRAVGREGFSLFGFFFGNLTYTVRGPRGGRVEWQDTGEANRPPGVPQALRYPHHRLLRVVLPLSAHPGHRGLGNRGARTLAARPPLPGAGLRGRARAVTQTRELRWPLGCVPRLELRGADPAGAHPPGPPHRAERARGRADHPIPRGSSTVSDPRR